MTDDPQELLPGSAFIKGDHTRLSININDEVAQFLRTYMAQNGVSATEATRRAFSVFAAIQEAHASRRIIQVCRKDGRPLYQLVIPE